jgi:quercetin dioxygenase-like cupin family protein
MSATTSPASTATIADVGTWPLDGLPGLEGRYLTVELPPGLRAPLHHHDGWQFVYVLEGAVVSQMEGEPATRYGQGAAWYEARRQPHVLFANETDRPAKVLVFYLTEPDTPVLTFHD